MTHVSRRTFVARTAAAAGAGLLAPWQRTRTFPPDAAPEIPRRPFGNTGVEVTMVGLGGGSRFFLPVPDDEHGAELVRRAIDRGICFIETGANYGDNNESEIRIGIAMKTRRSSVFLETKVDARDYDGAMREMERSLRLLQTDQIDLMLHHNISRAAEITQLMSEKGADKAIRKMVDQKLVRFRGFSCHSPQLLLDGIKRIEPQAIQVIANATRVPDVESEVLPLAKARGIAVVVMKSCGKGYFLPYNATKPDRIDQYGPPAGVFERKDLPAARDYIHYALTLPVATVVIGIDSLETLDYVTRDAAGFKPLTTAEMKSISERAQVFRTTGFWIPGRG
jgi:aryl-alcohol dehydrogenase-like predicted oxidoreductase